jgi:hypothetical protein
MSLARYVLGVVALACVLGSLGSAALSLRRRYLTGFSGAPARLAETVVTLALLTAVLELLGALGLFRLGPIVLASVLVGAGTTLAARSPVRGGTPRLVPSETATRPLIRALALVLAGLVLAEWAVPTLHSYDVGIRAFDSLWYHMPWAATFAQTGHVTPLNFTDVEYLTPFYPAGAELLHGFGIVMLGRDALSPGLNLVFLPLVLLAAWCVGRPRGLGAATMSGAALALGTPMMRFSQAGSAANDVVGVFFLIAAVALLVNTIWASAPADEHERGALGGPGVVAPLSLAALAAGLAIATKLSLLAPVLALSAGVVMLARPGRRRSLGGVWVAGVAVAGGFWYLRNLIAVGNPLPWLSFGVLPTPAAPLQAHTAFSVLHYAADGRIWSRFFEPGLADGLGPLWPLLLAAAILGPLACVARGPDRPTRVLGLVSLAGLLAYALTPESAAGPGGDPIGFAFNLRYAAPWLTLALAVTPLAAWRAGRYVAEATVVVIALLLAATLAQSRLWPGGYTTAGLLLGAAVAAVALLARAARERWTRAAHPRLVLLAAPALALVAAGAALGYAGERHYLRGRYVYAPHVSSLASLWQWFRGVHGARVGIVGTFGGFFAYPLFGLDGSNRVAYVARHGPHGSFTALTSCGQWRAAVNRGHFRYLVTTPARDPWHPSRLLASPEGSWTAGDPAARIVFRSRAGAQPITVFALRGALTPSACRVGARR